MLSFAACLPRLVIRRGAIAPRYLYLPCRGVVRLPTLPAYRDVRAVVVARLVTFLITDSIFFLPVHPIAILLFFITCSYMPFVITFTPGYCSLPPFADSA